MAGTHALGIDIGGTFTDIIIFDQSTGEVHKAKELTTHDDPARGVITGVHNALNGIVPPTEIFRTVHATTLFTNALPATVARQTMPEPSLLFRRSSTSRSDLGSAPSSF